MASPSESSEHERLAEMRAALRELEASVARLRARRAAERGYDPRRMSGLRAVGALDARPLHGGERPARGDARPDGGDSELRIISAKLVDARGRPGRLVLRLLRPTIRAVVDWWRRATAH